MFFFFFFFCNKLSTQEKKTQKKRRAAFNRLIKETLQQHGHYRITKEAKKVLQEVTEQHVTKYLELTYFLTLHTKRATLQPKDMVVLNKILQHLGTMTL